MGVLTRNSIFEPDLGNWPPQDEPVPEPVGAAEGTTSSQRAYATGNTAGYWTSDHAKEQSIGFRGWQYVGIHAIGLQWFQSVTNVYDSPGRPSAGGGSTPDSPDEHRKPNPNHPIARLLRRPNPFCDGQKLKYMIGVSVRLTGGFYLWEIPSQIPGIPAEWWFIPAGWLWPMPPTPGFPLGTYRITPVFQSLAGNYSNNFTASFIIDGRQLIRSGFPDPSYPGEYRSSLSACDRMIDISEQVEMAIWSSYANEVMPGLVVSLEKNGIYTPDQIAQMAADLNARKAGAGNKGKTFIAQGVTLDRMNKIGRASCRERVSSPV